MPVISLPRSLRLALERPPQGLAAACGFLLVVAGIGCGKTNDIVAGIRVVPGTDAPSSGGDDEPGIPAAGADPGSIPDAQSGAGAGGNGPGMPPTTDAAVSEPGDGSSPAPPLPVADGLLLWLDADFTPSFPSAPEVMQWQDRSANQHHVEQADADLAPTRITQALNGRSVVRFDGADDFLERSNADGAFDTSDLSILLVVAARWPSPQGSAMPSPFALRGAGNATRISVHLAGDKSEMHSWNQETRAAADYLFAQNEYYFLGFIWDGGTERHFVNGELLDTDTHNLGPTNGAPVRVGAAEPGHESFTGDIAEILVYGRALEDSDLEPLAAYIETKWGIDAAP